MGVHIGTITIDTNDLTRASAFWQAVTGYDMGSADDDGVSLVDPAGRHAALYLQVVPEPRTGKNRLHLDLVAADLEAEVARVRSLGATDVGRHDGWTVLADTDGNQFCIVAA